MSGPLKRAYAWIVGDDTGLSSEHLWSVMMGVPTEGANHPHDPDDIGRCFRLLRTVPEWQYRLVRMMRGSSPEWAALVARWDEIRDSFIREVGGLDPSRNSRAPQTYRLMREILDGARASVVSSQDAE